MNFKELKIGYVPYLPDLSQPGDRRRFPYFAKTNSVPFEIAKQDKFYDIILLTATANLSQWLIYKKKNPQTRFIFEMVDSLIFSPDLFNTLFKGIGRYIIGKESSIHFKYKNLLIEWLKIADIVICSSIEIKRIIEQWNKNVFVSLDYMQNEIKTTKSNYDITGKMKLVWEGQSVVLGQLLNLIEVFRQVNSFCELHIITDEEYPKYGNLIKRDVSNIINQLPITTVFHKWEIYKNYEMLSQCDCGIIPLDKENKMVWHKPANKLISFWFAGLPTVVSDSPAYVEFMNDAHAEFYCSNIEEWVSRIKEIKNMAIEERKKVAERNLNYVQKHYSDEALNLIWFQILKRLEVC